MRNRWLLVSLLAACSPAGDPGDKAPGHWAPGKGDGTFDADPDLGDGLDDVVRALPQDALRRAVAMQPFPDGSPLMWDAALGAQIATARRDLN